MDLLTVREVCEILRIKRVDTVRYMLRRGILKGHRMLSRKWLVEREDLEDYIRSKSNE